MTPSLPSSLPESAGESLAEARKMNDFYARAAYLRDAIETYPEDFDLIEGLLVALALTGQYELALAEADKLLGLVPETGGESQKARALLDKGDTLRRMKAPRYETEVTPVFEDAIANAQTARDTGLQHRILLRWSTLDEQISREVTQDPEGKKAGLGRALERIKQAVELASQDQSPSRIAEATGFYAGTVILGLKDKRINTAGEEIGPMLQSALATSEQVEDEAEKLTMQGNIHCHIARLAGIQGDSQTANIQYDLAIDCFTRCGRSRDADLARNEKQP